jgi:hypothetical protein
VASAEVERANRVEKPTVSDRLTGEVMGSVKRAQSAGCRRSTPVAADRFGGEEISSRRARGPAIALETPIRSYVIADRGRSLSKLLVDLREPFLAGETVGPELLESVLFLAREIRAVGAKLAGSRRIK